MKLEQMKIKELLDTSHTIAEKLFEGHEYPWEVLGDINGFIESLGASLPENEYKKIGKNIWIHKTAQMAPTTAMGGPMIIGPKVQIRNGAFLRGGVILGQHVVIGNSCEIKNSIIFDEAQVPHFNYVGDSILGDHAEIGCNSVLNPGTVIGRNSNVYPLSSVRGCVPSDSIYKGQDNIVVKEAREVETEQEAPEAPEKGKGGLKVVK